MKEITEEQRKALREPLPPEAITPHESKTYLSSIKPMFVIERLNSVFGVGAFQTRTEIVSTIENGKSKSATIKLFFTIPDYGISFETYGGADNPDLGDALKGAVTDALTKCASWLEIGIDVYKGKKSDGANAEKKEGTAKWLSDTQVTDMLAFIEKGKGADVKARMANYSIAGAKRKVLEAALEKAGIK